MNTQIDVLLLGLCERALYSLWENVSDEIERLHQIFNRFDENSELSCLRKRGMEGAGRLNDEWNEIFTLYYKFHNCSNGLFDVTIGEPETISYDAGERALSVSRSNKVIDFGGFAKGYAAKRIEQMLRKEGIENALINFGNSSITALGKHPHGAYWPIVISDPYTMEACFSYSLRDKSISSSGNGPRHEAHIFNPHTKEWMQGRRMVCIEASDPLTAEVLSTVCTCLDESEARRMVDRFSTEGNEVSIQQT